MPIEVKNISYIYMENTPYEKKALNNVSLTINEGEFVAIAGHTGSGKSTLMQHFNGLLNPTRGEVFIDGIDINKKKDKKTLHARRSVGMVFQYPEQQLFEESIFADIAFGPRNFGCSEDEVKQRVKEAMDFVELDYEEYKDKSPFLLSGGQMRRVAIAGIIALKPKYLVLDEPTAGLDPKERVRFRNLISAFSKDRIVILSTHIVSDVEFIAEDIIMMKDGQILHFGKTQEITTEIDGQVWECTVPTSRAEQYSETLNISNLRNIENNCTVLRVISEQSPMENAIKVEPTLEDLYLFYFKGVNE